MVTVKDAEYCIVFALVHLVLVQYNWGQSYLENDHAYQDGNASSQDVGDDSKELENVESFSIIEVFSSCWRFLDEILI